MKTMKIRRAIKKDVETISVLNTEVQKIHAAAYPNIFKQLDSDSSIKKFILQKIREPGNYFYIANLNREDIGYVYATVIDMPENPFMHQWKFIHIDQMAVKKKYQRMGCGKKLLDEVINLAEEMDIEQITLNSWLFNEQAQIFFKKQGFVPFQNRMWKTRDLSR